IVPMLEHWAMSDVVEQYSQDAALTIIGFREEMLGGDAVKFFSRFASVGDILFVNTSEQKEIV
ncbi:MAG: hypothetical protein LUE10_00640, partial [Alistipes sp.]|nr:hypothetical protein [Alistipes sp.]